MRDRFARFTRLQQLQRWIFYAGLLGLIVGAQLWRMRLATGRWFCVDELEHLHAAWCVGQGMVPYRDFFEHHSPLLYVVLAPLLKVMRPEESFGAAVRAILLCRWLMWGMSGFMLWLIYRLGREMYGRMGRAVGGMAVVFVLSTMMFVDRSTEIRPDMLSVPAMLGALVLVVRSFNRGDVKSSGRLWLAAGLLAGLSMLASPKSVFWILGFGPAAVIAILLQRKVELRTRWKMVAGLAIGGIAPLLVTLIVAAMLGAGTHYVQYNFVLNLQWKYRLIRITPDFRARLYPHRRS